MLNWCTGRVVDKTVWTPGLFTLRVAVSGVQPFEPGQFLHLGQQPAEGETISRAYSVASPHGPELEFFIVRVDGGQLTPVLEALNVGDTVQVKERAAGGFTLAKAPRAETIWLVGTGTGLAPYIAMLRDSAIWELYRNIVVCHGVRHEVDLGYRQELEGLQGSRPDQFRYVPAVSRGENGKVLNGRLTNLLENGALEQAGGKAITADTTAIMMCGNPDMLADMEKLLGQRGLQRHRSKSPGQIVLETYW